MVYVLNIHLKSIVITLYKGSFLKVNTSTKCDCTTSFCVCVCFVYASSSVFLLGLSCC